MRTGRSAAGCSPAGSRVARTTRLSPPPQAAAASSAASHSERFIGPVPNQGLEDGLTGRPQRTDASRGGQRMRFPRRARAALVALAAAVAPAAARAQLQLPQPQGYVNDFAEVIDPAYRDSLEAVIAAV